eukprot:m.223714 g.223714  ORF g.223714 m.223714 type:complete len:136 (+) comp17027_c0_seq3:1897-2304(+)
MRLICTDETGLVKSISFEKKAVVQQWREQNRANAPTRICFAPNTDQELYLGLANNAVQKLNMLNSEPETLAEDVCEGFAGLATTSERLVTCSSKGQVAFRTLDAATVVDEFQAHTQCNVMKLGLASPNTVAVGGM